MIYKKFGKRILDILLSVLLLPLLLLVTIPVGIAIKLDDGGTIFFKGKRLGKNMKIFKMYKFRTMKENAPDIRNKDGSTYNSEKDPRLTKIGGFLRKTSIDELPQILNVLEGTMSFIGPRPSPLGNLDIYTERFKRKFEINPGITGYNQAKLRNNATMKQREDNDIYYLENMSFALDIKIAFLTVKNILKKKNINRN